MSVFNVATNRKSKKKRQCAWCCQPIPIGDEHKHFIGKWEGEFQNWRMHHECFDAYDDEGMGEFSYGDNDRPAIVPVLTK